jgi:hypothetical protein
MNKHLREAEAYASRLRELANENHVPGRSGDEIATDQIAEFGGLLLHLARYMDDAQWTIKALT